jgi:hypothetical protein
VIFRRRAWQGRLVDPTTALGRWEIGESEAPASVLMLERRDLAAFRNTALLPEGLIALSPDAVLVHRPAGQPEEHQATLIAVWAQWTPAPGKPPAPRNARNPRKAAESPENAEIPAAGEALRRRCEWAAHRLQQVGAGGQVRGLLLEPTWPGAAGGDASEPIHVAADPRGRLPHGGGAASGACHGLKLPLPLTAGWDTLGATLEQVLL